MSTLLQYLPFDLQKEVGKLEHANKLKKVHEDLKEHTIYMRDTYLNHPVYPEQYKYMVYPLFTAETCSYTWGIGDDSNLQYGYAYHSIKDIEKFRKRELERDVCRLTMLVSKLKSLCTPKEWEQIVSKIETSLK
jgi:hypothetical protein